MHFHLTCSELLCLSFLPAYPNFYYRAEINFISLAYAEQTNIGGRNMSLTEIKKEIETERLIGYRYTQQLCRAEALVAGAGREAVEPLLWDANAAIIRCDVQNERIVLDGTLQCQAVYRQGEETTLRALSAKSAISQVIELVPAQSGMLCRTDVQVEHVEARYENGHMVFQVGLGLRVWVMALERIEAITDMENSNQIETRYEELRFVKLAADAGETAVMTAEVELPHSLDARNTLMDWGNVLIDSVQQDLGGIRVKGRAMIETLVSSGIEGRPAVVVKYPIEFDKLLELPEWLSQNVGVSAQLRSIRTQVENDENSEEGRLLIQTDVHFSISANVQESVRALMDAYGVGSKRIEITSEEFEACNDVTITQNTETIRGTVIADESSAAIGSVIAVRTQPNLAEVRMDEKASILSGIIDADVLYMPAGSDIPASTHTELPFEMKASQILGDTSQIRLSVVSSEANALMSDRLEMKILLCADCETRHYESRSIVQQIEQVESEKKRSGYIICWQDESESAWDVGKRYGIAESIVLSAAGQDGFSANRGIVLNV